MERREPRVTVAMPISAMAMAAGAAACFAVGDAVGFLTDATEDVFIVSWLLGWVLLSWAAIVGGGYAVHLGFRLRARQRVYRQETALVAVTLLLIAVVAATHPLWGTGTGVGS